MLCFYVVCAPLGISRGRGGNILLLKNPRELARGRTVLSCHESSRYGFNSTRRATAKHNNPSDMCDMHAQGIFHPSVADIISKWKVVYFI